MNLEITPEPSDDERAAIEAALADEVREERASVWADLLLPERAESQDP